MSRGLAPGWVAVLSCALAACNSRSEEAPRRQQGLAPSEVPPPAPPRATTPAPTPSAPPPSSLPSPFAQAAPNPGALARTEDASPADAAAAAARDAEPERDLGQELAAVLGQPIRCLDVPAVVAGGGKLTITATAQVMPSGRITRASASAPGQPAEALRCIEGIVTAGRLQGSVPGAPRQVAASVTIQAAPAR